MTGGRLVQGAEGRYTSMAGRSNTWSAMRYLKNTYGNRERAGCKEVQLGVVLYLNIAGEKKN
jgi:hypothetical protein